jgi:DNA replication protein DnaC
MTELDAMLKRLHLPTVRRLYRDLQNRAEQESMGYTQYLTTLVEEEVAHRTQTRIQRAVRKARFPFLRTIEEFDFTFQTSIRHSLLASHLGPDFVASGRSLVLFGPSGTGKSHLAIAIAYRAIQNGSDALFTSAATLIDELSSATRQGRLRSVLPTYTHPPVLVIDEVGYLTYGTDAANVLFQVVNDRYLHKRPMIFTTNKPMEAWGKVLHDADLAEAILDRVLEHGRLLHLRGPSFRTRHLGPSFRGTTPSSGESPPTPSGISQPATCLRISGKSVSEFSEPTPFFGEMAGGVLAGSPNSIKRPCNRRFTSWAT